MKDTLLLLLVLISNLVSSQEANNELNKDLEEVSFAIIEHVPLYTGCNEKDSNKEKKKCMSIKIQKHVASNFNTNISKSLNLPDGKQKIQCFFTIDKDGSIINVKIRASHPDLEAEAKRVINAIPKMKKPGFQRGKPVKVTFFLPIIFNVENTPKKPLTKKELKEIERAKKKLAKKLAKELKKLAKESNK